MAKARASYICETCDARHQQWSGQCGSCGAWNSIVEHRAPSAAPSSASVVAVPLGAVQDDSAARRSTGMVEFDRVLGGGLVAGALVLIGGDPGIGKSTLVLRAAAALGTDRRPVLYAAAEESPQQLRMRASRMGLEASAIHIYPDTEIGGALSEAQRLRAGLIVVDSIQTVRVEGLGAAPGSVSQVREATMQIMQFAKTSQTPVLLVGHVTKEGTVAGPRTLEHIVDTVLYLEGDDFHAQRLLRSVKNRFGPTFEVAVFEMRGDGLREVPNPSALFLAERDARAPGSAVAVTLEGTRPLVVEVQALAAPTAYALPKRLATGFDLNRLHMLLAVLGRRAGVQLGQHDVYLNVVGGLRLREPAVDLAVAIAIASSARDIATGSQVAAIGEIGLSGELRSVPSAAVRVREAQRLGFTRCLVPATSARNGAPEGVGAANLAEALALALR